MATLTAEREWLGQRRTAGGVTGPSTFIRFFPVGPNEAFRFAFGSDRGWIGLGDQGDTGDTVPWPSAPMTFTADRSRLHLPGHDVNHT